MSFTIQLTPDLTPVEPGSNTPVSVVVTNRSEAADRFEMEIEGIDPEWKAVPVPVFSVDAGDAHSEKVFFKPRRDSESLSGNYPFVVRIRSLESGEQRTAQGVLQIRPFHHVTMEISPKKGFVSPARKQNYFDVTLVNLGNTEHTMHLVGGDPEDACAYEFDQEQVTLGPGQQKEIELAVNPTTQPLLSGAKLIGFTVSARSVDAPAITASSQAQLEQRSLFSPTSIIVGVLLAVLIGAWLMMMPKPPSISLSADPMQAQTGDQITISWQAERASKVTVKMGDNTLYEGPDLRGSKSVTLNRSGTLTVVGVASKDGNEKQETLAVTVSEPAPVPSPQVSSFGVDRNRIKLGESFILKYTFNAAVTRAVIQPLGSELDLALNELEITPKSAGTATYTVVAMNSKGEQAKKSVSVTIVDESDARIPVFRAEPNVVKEPASSTSLNWFVTGADRVELSYNGQTSTIGNSGPLTVEISTKTTFTITAYDHQGRSINRKITVDFQKLQLPPESDPNTDATTTGSGSDSGGTTGVTTGAATTGGLR
jgi:hypothetical protein